MSQRFLTRAYTELLNTYRGYNESAEIFPPDQKIPAYSMWLQGPELAPQTERLIFNNQERHLSAFDYHIISLRDLDSYVELPGYLYDRYRNGNLTPAAMSDIARCALLKQHGGVWLDSTVVLLNDLQPEIARHAFYFAKNIDMDFPLSEKWPQIQTFETYFMAGEKNSLLFNWLYDTLLSYWGKHDTFINYLQFNDLGIIALNHIPTINAEFNHLPDNNMSCEKVCPALSKQLTDAQIDQFSADGTTIFKLNLHAHFEQSALSRVLRR